MNRIIISDLSLLTINGLTLDKNKEDLIAALGGGPDDEAKRHEYGFSVLEYMDGDTYTVRRFERGTKNIVDFQMSGSDGFVQSATVFRYMNGMGPEEFADLIMMKLSESID